MDPLIKNKVTAISLNTKIFTVINEIISILSKGRPIDYSNSNLTGEINFLKTIQTQNVRTICLLKGLKIYFERHLGDLTKDLENYSIEYELDISVNGNSLANLLDIGNGNVAKWKISYPLFLIQIIRFSQIEWGNQDYNYEFFSAIRGYQFFKNFFSSNAKIFLNFQAKEPLKILSHTIRWFSLNGQYERGSSKFNTQNINLELDFLEKYLLEKPLLFVDRFLRIKNFKNEKTIRDSIIQKREINEGDFEIPSMDFDDKKDNFNQKLFLFSNLAINEEDGSNIAIKSFNDSIREKLIAKSFSEANKSKKKENFCHFVFAKFQLDKGILKDFFNSFEGKIDDKIFNDYFDFHELTPPSKTEVNDQFEKPAEKIYLVFIRPYKVLELVYGLKFEKEPSKAIKFINDSFEQIRKKYSNKLPLPIVHFILNLLPFYNYNLKEKSQPGKIIFDGIEKVEFWLPDVENEDELGHEVKNDGVKLKEVIQRFILYFITNYGMILEFKKVDIDLSAFKHKFWHDLIVNNDDRERLGIHIFEKYLEDCGANILTTTYAIELYNEYISERKLFDRYSIEINDSWTKERISDIDKTLNNKFLLGIDIGASGIKMKFFQIIKNIEGNKEGDIYEFLEFKEDPIECKKKEESSIDEKSDKYYLVAEIDEYFIPTARGNSESDKYLNADDFASYLFNGLREQVNYKSSEFKRNNWDDYIENLISIGIAWPGPIKQNKIATTSGIIKFFKDMTHFIYMAEKTKINHIQIAESVERIFKGTKNKTDENFVVTLANDGNVEASGFVFGKINVKYLETNFEAEIEGNTLKEIIKSGNVAIIKAGTGTAGAILKNGNPIGLNEFGKIIVDLNAENNLDKKNFEAGKKEYIFPRGDLNKFFSINFLREVAREVGVPSNVLDGLSGRDFGLLFQKGKEKYELIKEISDEKIKLFGVLELMDIIKPKIKWSQVVNPLNNTIRELTLQFDGKNNFYLESCSPGSTTTTTTSSSSFYIEMLNLLQNPLSFSIDCSDFHKLLTHLGKVRVKRFNIERIIKEKHPALDEIGLTMGKRLADAIGLINTFVPLNLVVIAGGPIADEALWTECEKGVRQKVNSYLSNRLYEGFQIFSKDSTVNYRKIYYLRQGKDFAILGAAMLGFDSFVKLKKLKELRALSTMEKGYILRNSIFLNFEEAENFILDNVSQLRITYDPVEGIIESLGTKTESV